MTPLSLLKQSSKIKANKGLNEIQNLTEKCFKEQLQTCVKQMTNRKSQQTNKTYKDGLMEILGLKNTVTEIN